MSKVIQNKQQQKSKEFDLSVLLIGNYPNKIIIENLFLKVIEILITMFMRGKKKT